MQRLCLKACTKEGDMTTRKPIRLLTLSIIFFFQACGCGHELQHHPADGAEDREAGDPDGGDAHEDGPDGADILEDVLEVTMDGDGDGGDAEAGGDDGGSADGGGDEDPAAPVPPSCEGMSGDECNGVSCCTTITVAGGWFAMGRGEETACPGAPVDGAGCTSASTTCLHSGTTWGCPEGVWIDLGGDDHAPVSGGDDEVPEHPVLVARFSLDMFEVTVARMRSFVEAYDKTELTALLASGAGEHPLIAGSMWNASWNARLPDDRAALEEALACHESQTWTDAAGSNETYPINCTSWYLAYAFCAWDGGRLPTEAEWEYVAAGGDENLLYPWGYAAPSSPLANYLDSDNTPYLDVFAKPAGAGRWGHAGMAGSMWEWVLDLHDPDWYATGGADCRNCANLTGEGARTMRGGDWQYTAADLRGAGRFAGSSGSYWLGAGLRCARDL
jgi:sulfatase modifying factor 1